MRNIIDLALEKGFDKNLLNSSRHDLAYTLYVIQKWLREQHGLHITVTSPGKKRYVCWVDGYKGCTMIDVHSRNAADYPFETRCATRCN